MVRSPRSDPQKSKCVESHVDEMLHRRLSKILCKRGLSSSSSSSRIKDFLHTLENSKQNSIINLILVKLKAVLGGHFSIKKLRKLSFLWIGVLASFHKSAELLVHSGADVNELFGLKPTHSPLYLDEKSTVLHALLRMSPSPKNERLIRLVTNHGADLQARDSKGRTVLHIAVKKGPVKLTEMLLEKGADVNVANNVSQTPLLIAASRRKAGELLPLLMKHGADFRVRDANGANVLHRLSAGPVEHVDLARIFIERGVSLDDREHSTQSQPIHLAALKGHSELVKLYLDHGANINSLATNGESPLYLAVRGMKLEVLETLLERGADVNLRTISEGRTALHVVCEQIVMDQENIRLLLSAGADVLVEDEYDHTPFALLNEHNYYVANPGTWLIVRKLALIKVCQPSIELKDEKIIKRFSAYSNFYRNCIKEIERTKITRFVESCTIFELLTKCHCQIAALMRNPEFEINFRNCDVMEFSTYANDISRAFERAQKHHRSMLEQEDVINEAVYGILPYVVVRKVVHHMFTCCENGNK